MRDPMHVLAPEHRLLRIGDAWRGAASGATFTVEDPATGGTVAEVADAGAADGLAALDAASKAMADWAATPPRRRSELLTATYRALTERSEDVARLITLEMGKPLAEARAEVAYGAEFFRWFAEEAVRVEGRYSIAPGGGCRILTVPKPVGPCVFVTPWNFPLAMGARKIAPALAAGCTTITKPAALTPLTMLLLARIMEEAGVPPGVVNVVTTKRAGEVVSALLRDDRTRKISFTGSTEVGRGLLRQAADNVLRTSMELGGNAALIVCADADLDVAVDGAMVAKMRNIGESCIAANRIYVEEPVREEFTTRFAGRMAALSVGHGLTDGVDVGALIDAPSVAKVDELVADAVDRGARVVVGGRRPDGPGYFYPPTVLVDVPEDARMLTEEIFGPVAPIISFTSDDEVMAKANDTGYGLAAYVFTRDLQRALRYAEGLETGMLGVNRGLISDPSAPFGGVKQSGIGKEGSHEGILEYLDLTYVAIDLP
ncbi:NAD-dependent succinate-semialdehyde dehydrogenase [Actinoplanes philippinensis]|uniref:Succinate-semialdehyde dehydrogenase / glutarate-semialdehyde dehydrogenase n=1 Tax=Actinoplanes philippinensis TaxID=35752 RepID=A0A1I2GTR2_9ACTN|nr:NAD-dependent succinate-semialdehyde dehydrogenase [Actinoplanes philippinensis]GIE78092.1 NAD-dependent succinate-semialdehyde dehydrogenase [Actinoplanes philippinensis]SFF20852.1 succinate-semialdehyde dehydrogenase / glutarate-semialdehyde dehydrogenase [Actinoplanes philippinensis]